MYNILHKIIKRYLLGYLMLLWLVGLSATLKAATPAKQPNMPESYRPTTIQQHMGDDDYKEALLYPDDQKYNDDEEKMQYPLESTPSHLPMPKNLGEMKIFPSPYEYAHLSKDVYRDKVAVGSSVYQLDDWVVCAELSAKDNSLSRIFKALGLPYGYSGRLYKHRYKKQMVLAHRGTDPKNASAVKTDIQSIVQHDIGGQERLTIDLVAQALAKVAEEGMCSLSFTGHSLGGWLAQVSLFVFFDQAQKFQTQHPNLYKKLYVKAVTFDTPGALAMLEQMNSRNDALSIDHLDITNYLSTPNLVNCCNFHVGTLYRVVFKSFSKLPGKYTKQSHTIDNFIEAFDPHTKDAKHCLFMRSWPKLNLEHLKNRLTNLNKAKVILHALLLLKDCATGELLGEEYGNFFTLAHQTTTHVDPQELTGTATFDLEYKYHYKSRKPDYARFHRRHISKPIYRPLEDLLSTTLPYFYGLKKASQDDRFTLASNKDNRLFLDALMQKGPQWLATQSNMHHAQSVVIQTSAVAAPPVDIRGKSNLPELPHRDEYIIKRKDTSKALHLRFQAQPMQVIIGYGGLGKSTLARLYADAYFDPKGKSYYDYVWWFHAEDQSALRESIEEICSIMGITSNDKRFLNRGMQQIKAKLQSYSNTRWLLIFDNLQQPQDISCYFRKAIQGGHILITSRNGASALWKKHLGQSCTVTPIPPFSRPEAVALLDCHHQPKDEDEEKAQQALLDILEDFDPLALSQIGHCISRASDHFSEKKPYQKYYDEYKIEDKLIGLLEDKELELSPEAKNYISPSIVATFEKTLDKIKEEMQKEEKQKKNKLEETLRILRVIALLHPDGLDWCFLQYLRRSRKGDFFKQWFQDRAKCIEEVKAKEAVACLRAYGILLDQGVKCRTHRTIQAIMRWKIKNATNKNLITYIEDQALELLETVQQQMHTITHLTMDELRFTMAAHCHTLMKHLTHYGKITKNKEKKYIRLLRVMSQIDQLTYLKDKDLYLPPQATQSGDLHQQVLNFINTTYSNFSSKKKWLSNQPYTPVLLLQGGAGTGKSTYGVHLVNELWKIYYASKRWAHIPLFISLPEFCSGGDIPTDLIKRALAKKGIAASVIDEQIKTKAKLGKQPWVFIFDGYDEIHGKQNLFTHCNLKTWGIAYSKYIISCRTTYLAELDQTLRPTLFEDHENQEAEKLIIAPYAQDQIEDYVKNFAVSPYNLYGWSADDYKDKLDEKRYATLKDWMTTPFLLVVGLQALPRIAAAQKDPNIPLSPTTIYKAFVEEWLYREENKPQHKIAKEKLRSFCEELAYTLWQKNTFTLKRADKTMTSFFKNTYALQSAPLRYLGNNRYMFIHVDFQDFFAASFILKNIAKKRLNPNLPSFNRNIKAFLLHYKDSLWHYLHQTQQVPSMAASNSVQILCCAGHKDFRKAHLARLDLGGVNLAKAKLPQDLSNTKLSGATLPKDLSNTKLSRATLPKDLSSTNLSGANLSHTDLSNIKLPQDLSNTNLSGATLPKDLSNTNLSGANLSHTDLSNIKLPQDVSSTNLSGATLPKDLSSTNLSGATLPKDLSSTNLSGANLSHTDLSNIKLPHDLSNTNLSGATLPKDLSSTNLSGANLSHTDLSNIKLPHDLSNTNLSGANLSHTDLSNIKLPQDLSSIDLTYANLTGQRFTSTNFEGTQLDSAILTKTICDYQQCFQDNLAANQLSGGQWYRENLPNDLKSITQVYDQLSQNTYKIELLLIASNLAYLPYWESTEFYIKVQYWSCKLLMLKKELGNGLGQQLVCSLEKGRFGYGLNEEAQKYCWQTDYPQDKEQEEKEEVHDDFDQYLKTFQAGLVKYNCKSKSEYGFKWYKRNIEKNIQGLKKAYPKLTSEKLRKEAVDIAFQLSKKCKIQHLLLLFRYLFLQNRLIRLKISAGVIVENDIHYNLHVAGTLFQQGWSHSGK